MINIDGKQYWKFDTDIIREVPKINERKHLIEKAHEKINHGNNESTYMF